MIEPNAVASTLVQKRVLDLTHSQLGSMLEIGELRRLEKRIPNPHLTLQQQWYQGSHSLFIECAWELYPPLQVYPPSEPLDPLSPDWYVPLRRLDVLAGSTIVSAHVAEPGLVLTVGFDNHMQLTVKPREPDWEYESYKIRIERYHWVVVDGCHVREAGPAPS